MSLHGQEFDRLHSSVSHSVLNDRPGLFVGWAYQRLYTPSPVQAVFGEPQRELTLPYFDTPEGSTPHVSWIPRCPVD
jgi:hypothetical protein